MSNQLAQVAGDEQIDASIDASRIAPDVVWRPTPIRGSRMRLAIAEKRFLLIR